MATGDLATEAALQDLLEWLASWTWPVDESQAMALAEARGWTVVHHRPGDGAYWDTGLVGDRPWASATVLDGFVSSLRVTTAKVPGDETPESRGVVRDAFADQVALVSGTLGSPQSRTPGRDPSVEWDLASGAALKVGEAGSCYWVLTSPKFVKIQRDLER